MLTLKAHAKINLALEVMESVNGYHLVNNIMIPISLYDEITLERANESYIVDNKIEDNIMLKAARLFLDEFKINSGVKITIKKNIPISAGLAGGSTDAGAILRGLNILYNTNASNEQLMALASRLGSDVPFFIEEKCALCTNRGEVINKLECKLEPINLLLIKVAKGSSTAQVYKNYSYSGIRKEKELNNIIEGLKENNSTLVIDNIFNDLTKPALFVNEDLSKLYNKLKENGLKPRISGSGPTMYLINPSDSNIELVNKLISSDTIVIKANTI